MPSLRTPVAAVHLWLSSGPGTQWCSINAERVSENLSSGSVHLIDWS